jgi:regulator of sirC expression with transglutaminase-like and TPR domain
MITSALERLNELVRGPDQDLDLAEAALLLATTEYPALDVPAYLAQLDELAARLSERLPHTADLEQRVVSLNEFLFEELGFSGNTDNYYDPRNNFLNEVLDRKLGIPITLCILYMEIGRRVGLELEGVSFPGHFLVKFATDEGDVVLDPFAGGVPLTEEELVDRLEDTYGQHRIDNSALPQLLAAASKRDILVRMLRNLKVIYLHHERFEKALDVINQILLIGPELAEEVRERGELYERLECHRSALLDYQRYLRLEPQAPDLADIRNRIIALEPTAHRLN